MKTLFLIRHAKSSWDDPSVKDFDRELNDRGRKNAPEMAKRLLSKGIVPDIFLCSTARRALETAKLMMAELTPGKPDLIRIPELYLSSPDVMEKAISLAPDQAASLALVAHNPGITEYASMLTSEIRIDNMPTAAIFAVEASCNTWAEFPLAPKKFLFFDYPKLRS